MAKEALRFLLQLIEASDGQLTGRYGQTLLIDGLKLERMNASVKGRSNDGLIVLEIKPPEVLSNTFVLSGSVTDSQLSLKGGGSGGSLNLSLEKAPEDEYQAQIAVLTKLALKNASDSYLNKRLERQTLL